MFTTLQQLIDRGKDTITGELNLPANDRAARELQTRLCDLGLLDPAKYGPIQNKFFGPTETSDGALGQDTRNAIFEFCRLAGIPYAGEGELSVAFLRALVGAVPEQFLPIETDNKPGEDSPQHLLAKRIVRHMRQKKYWIARSPNMCNIVYAEGMNAAGTEFADVHNEWNDRRMVIRIAPGGKPEIVLNHSATTEPGTPKKTPPPKAGIARIGFGQYKAWMDGLHKRRQLALVQTGGAVRVWRDKNKDHIRPGDLPDDGLFGINQHSTFGHSTVVNDWSAGCLVGRHYHEHLIFLSTVKQDIRYLLNKNYVFISTVVPGNEI